MYPPVDYPIKDKPTDAAQNSETMTYAALLAKHASEEVITEAMIQAACLRIETAQQVPVVDKPEAQSFGEVSRDATIKV